MRRGLTGDIHAVLLRLTDQRDGFLCGNVTNVVGTPGLAAQADIPLDGAPLAFGADPAVTMCLGVRAVVDAAAEKQAVVLRQIMNLSMVGNAAKADLRNINEGSACGSMAIKKDVTDENIILINRSVTGVYESRVNLSTV